MPERKKSVPISEKIRQALRSLRESLDIKALLDLFANSEDFDELEPGDVNEEGEKVISVGTGRDEEGNEVKVPMTEDDHGGPVQAQAQAPETE
jgi:hypothetical protein